MAAISLLLFLTVGVHVHNHSDYSNNDSADAGAGDAGDAGDGGDEGACKETEYECGFGPNAVCCWEDMICCLSLASGEFYCKTETCDDGH